MRRMITLLSAILFAAGFTACGNNAEQVINDTILTVHNDLHRLSGLVPVYRRMRSDPG